MNIKAEAYAIRLAASKLDPEAAAMDARESDDAMKTHLAKSKKEIWLVSREDESVFSVGGQVVSAHPMNAARMMKERTHELATEAQVQAHKADLHRKAVQIEAEETDRKGVSAKQLMEMFMASQQPAGASRGKQTRE